MDRGGEVKLTPGGASDPRRALPSVDRLAHALEAADASLPAWAALAAARATLVRARDAREPGTPAALETAALARARSLARAHPARLVNATGVILHTNLGRAPLAAGAAEAAASAGAAFSDLELDLASGERGERLGVVAALLVALSGAEAAHAVNNNAAALLLAVDALARGREVVVSRGELVEIGGSFRIPEIVERAGARLVEVGTTNRTHADDYRRAVGSQTGLLLKVHRSNFEQRGFVADVALPDLVALGREVRVPVVEDLGSATLVDLRPAGLPEESYAPARVATGADLVCFSGDKLLGGPQAGLLLGRAGAVEAARRSPLARALRLDKLSLAALDYTLRALLEGRRDELPALRQLTEPAAAVEARARSLAERLAKAAGTRVRVALVPVRAAVGGGSLPGFELDSFAVALRCAAGAERLADALRAAPVPVVGRVRDDALLLDARTLLPGDAEDCEAALATVLGHGAWETPC
ncbi:MAG TPA: L-seryl-tRNA(Sec) selenium transferase [Myxococcota bacterium]|jgi:L-seryl-tRNA(Ser) seleniumtransferase|nr:L-seryl-tRNA(Sec) selenium transferase [Myxococcota bacterium]